MEIFLHHEDLPDTVTFEGSVAIDTETTGLSFERDRLCVIQLSSGDGNAHLIKYKPGSPYKSPNLVKILKDASILKLFHFGRFDIAMLQKHFGIATTPVYCTKIASKLVRTYTDRQGLKDLCSELLKVEISKQQQTTDWGKDILSEEQMQYAASDVLYLHQLKNKLDEMLKREGRMEVAQASFNYLPVRAQLDLMGWDGKDIFAHSDKK